MDNNYSRVSQIFISPVAVEVILHLWMCSRNNPPRRHKTAARGVLRCVFDIPLWLPEDKLEALRLDWRDNSSNNYISCYWDVDRETRDCCGQGKLKKKKNADIFPYFSNRKTDQLCGEIRRLSRSILMHINVCVLLDSSNKPSRQLLIQSHQLSCAFQRTRGFLIELPKKEVNYVLLGCILNISHRWLTIS